MYCVIETRKRRIRRREYRGLCRTSETSWNVRETGIVRATGKKIDTIFWTRYERWEIYYEMTLELIVRGEVAGKIGGVVDRGRHAGCTKLRRTERFHNSRTGVGVTKDTDDWSVINSQLKIWRLKEEWEFISISYTFRLHNYCVPTVIAYYRITNVNLTISE